MSNENKDRKFSRRNFLQGAIAGGIVAAAGTVMVEEDRRRKQLLQKNAQKLIEDIIMTDRVAGELRHHFPIREIIKAFSWDDLFPVPPTTMDDLINDRKDMLNQMITKNITGIFTGTTFSNGTVLDAAIARRSAADPNDREQQKDLYDLVEELVKNGAGKTQQTIDLVEARIKLSAERRNGLRDAELNDRLKEQLKGYDWKRDVEVMQRIKEFLSQQVTIPADQKARDR